MKTFMSIKSKLSQDEMPMSCDEKVYQIVKEIQLRQHVEFSSLVPMLGTFHMVKTALKCIGKSLDGSGAEFICLDASVFGPTVIQNSVLNGDHYGRSLEGMQLLSEAIQ